MYAIILSRHAVRVLKRMDGRQRELIDGRLDGLARDPRDPQHDVRKLSGRSGYRLRVGTWRIIYEIDDTVRIIAVEDVVQRGKAYR